VVSAIAEGEESQDSAEATFDLPYPWRTQDVGTTGFEGEAVIDNGVFTVAGSGVDIWDTVDGFRFLYVPVTGNCVITARVISVENTDPWAKAGVMIRGALSANSVNAYVAVTPGNGVTFQYRSATGGSSSFSNTTGLGAPYWVRLVRSGNTFTAYRSVNGLIWTQQGSAVTISMPSIVYVGLAVTAHNNGLVCTAAFDNVTVPGWLNWTVPPVPGGLAGEVVDGQVRLSWEASSTASSYNVKRSTEDGGPYTIVTNTSATEYVDGGLAAGRTYYYVVSALNPAGESADSEQVQFTLVPSLGLLVEGSTLTLWWPGGGEEFRLQYRTNLVLGEWVDVTPEPEAVEGGWRVVQPISQDTPSMFYRLVK